MPSIDCVKAVDIKRTARVLQLEGLFDVPPARRSERRFQVDLPIEREEWSIGLIVGPSGSGKSTVLREAFGTQAVARFDWLADRAVVDAFPLDMPIKTITGLLSSVGFSSPPSWLRPFRCLSTGEQFRAEVARALAESPALAVIDEYTSVVDRTVAQVASAALAKWVRRRRQKLVAATCHSDVIDWLRPDWVLEMPNGDFTWRLLQQRPAIALEIERVHHSAWQLFRHHHYLDGSLNRAAYCFVGRYAGRPAAFASCLHQTCRGGGYWREHRTVCLPDYQGVGIGNALSEFVGALMLATGKRYFSTTANPAMIQHRSRSPAWRLARKPRLASPNRGEGAKGYANARTRAVFRNTAGFEFVGAARVEEAERFGIENASLAAPPHGCE
jgi:ABC-type lipoprotein export system ATPase subunit